MPEALRTSCVIAGGGPAGLMLGYLLARAGVKVIVLEKHSDFLRDFRGDTVHPSTLEVMHELGLLERFLKLPHQKVERLTTQFGTERISLADFSSLPVRCKFIAMMPQWDLLNFLAEEGRRFTNFNLRMETEARSLIEDGGRIIGVRAAAKETQLEIKADLVIGADGRGSQLRAASGLTVEELGAPMDALWFRLPRKPSDTEETQGRFDPGRIFVMLNRGDYWQCAFVIPKGSLENLKKDGIEVFRTTVGQLLPFESSRAEEIKTWEDAKLLTVKVDRLRTWWKPGLLFIGDAAHAMSPVGGVGINLAVQDAVAAANILAQPLKEGAVRNVHLAAVERRRTFPTRMTQRLQVGVQNSLIAPTLSGRASSNLAPPLVFRLVAKFPWLRRVPARLMGLGVRPEHVSTQIRNA